MSVVKVSEFKGLLTYAEAAKLLGIEKKTLYNWVLAGKIPYVRFSKKCVRFYPDDLYAFMRSHTIKPME